jgi:hypothetical protein
MPVRLVAAIGLALMAMGRAPGSGPTADPQIKASQVTLETSQVSFQATVIDRRNEPARLTVVTAAHGLFPLGEGTRIVIRPAAGGVVLRGTVESAEPNPGYKPVQSRDPRSALRFQGAIGSDNSVLTLRLELGDDRDRRAFGALHTVPVTARPVPDRKAVSVLTVHVVDRSGVEHVVKAGNSLNPKWLTWGARYRPRPGDSGAGVFVVAEAQEPQAGPRIVLIGNVVASDEAGGIAALFSQAEFPALTLTARPPKEAR